MNKPWGRQYVMPDGNKIFLDGYGTPPDYDQVAENYLRDKARDEVRDPRAIAFGRRVRQARIDHNLTLREAGNPAGIDVVEFCKIERGRRPPTDDERRKLVEIMPELEATDER